MNNQKDHIIQQMKNKDVLMKWRETSRLMQMKNDKGEEYDGLESPFGTSLDLAEAEGNLTGLSVEDFQKEFTNCWEKLNEFTSRPASITDVDKAMIRLREVEEIQKKLCALKLSMKAPVPY